MTTERQDAINARVAAKEQAESAARKAGHAVSTAEYDAINEAHPIPSRNQDAIEQTGKGEFDKPTKAERIKQNLDRTCEAIEAAAANAEADNPLAVPDAVRTWSDEDLKAKQYSARKRAEHDPAKLTDGDCGEAKLVAEYAAGIAETEEQGIPPTDAETGKYITLIAAENMTIDELSEAIVANRERGIDTTVAEEVRDRKLVAANTQEQPGPTPNPICVAVLSFDTGPDKVMVVSSPQWLEQAVDTMPGERHVYGNGMQGERWGFRLNTLRQWTCKVVTPPPQPITASDRAEAALRGVP